ncbi:hypothetical protein BGZ59_009992 [Podila verticillata]|nr:hypothetical protein BGZ59_009992 [Podila verticillata]
MSMARKIAGVTKDSNQQVYETLESRFGMFLASNTHGAQFSIQCVGPVHGSTYSSTASSSHLTHMELAGDSGTDDAAVDSLLDELQSVQDEDEFLEEEGEDEEEIDQVAKDKDPMAKVMESNAIYDQYQASIQSTKGSKTNLADHVKRALEMERSQRDASVNHSQGQAGDKHEHVNSKQDTDSNLASLARFNSNENEAVSITTTSSSFSEKVSRGAALFKGAIQKYKKPAVMSDLSNNASVDTLKLPPFNQPTTQSSTRTSSNISDTSSFPDENSENNDKSNGLTGAIRTGSGNSDSTSSITQYEDFGHGNFPTVRISSRPGGHFDGELRVSHGEDIHAPEKQDKSPQFLKLQAHHPEMHETCNGIVNLIEPEGISVISDIDDTIKETNVTAGARTILRNTFLKEMREVEGMSQTYQQWWKQGAAVHYVSNSPWQLIPSLLDFFHTHMFPPGSAHLRLHDSVLKTYFMSPPGENKRRCIREILSDFPDRKFILVGDSGEIDMEIYTEMALAYPDQIFRIFIRDITTSRLKEMMMTKSSPLPSPLTPFEFQASRSRSFSSMLLPKTPINSVVTSGLSSLFSRRGSTVSATESPVAKIESPTELSDEENAKVVSPTPDSTARHMEVNTHFEPSGPYADPIPETPSSSSHITAGVKAITNSILASTIRKSVSLSPSSPRLSTKNGWIQGFVRARSGSISPRSPLAVESMTMTGYPFPVVEAKSKATSSSTALSLSEGDDEGTTSKMMTTKDRRDQDIFEGFEPIGQEYPVAKAPPRSRTETWSSSASTSSQLTMMPERPGPIPLGITGRSKSTVNLSSSLVDGASESHSSSFSLSTKSPLEVWQERVDKCQRQLPEGMLTLFESAKELQECPIVHDMFSRY